MYDQAKALHTQGSYSLAVTSYNALISKHPGSAQAEKASRDLPVVLFDLANDLHEKGSLDESIAAYQGIITDYPQTQSAKDASLAIPMVFLDRARAYHDQGFYAQTIDTYNKIIDYYPGSQPATGASEEFPWRLLNFIVRILTPQLKDCVETLKSNASGVYSCNDWIYLRDLYPPERTMRLTSVRLDMQ